jgi:hypothetical protein
VKDSGREKDALLSHPMHDKDVAVIFAALDQPSPDERRMHLKEGLFFVRMMGST